MQNPVSYFEIPVTDMERAIDFYQRVFEVELERTELDGHDMALFPADEVGPGASGALARGKAMNPRSPDLAFTSLSKISMQP